MHEDIKTRVLVLNPLAKDVTRSLELLKADFEDQYYRRNLVRASFAYIEAFSFVFRQILLMMIVADPKRKQNEVISEADLQSISLLLEQAAVPASNGAINLQQQKTPLVTHVAFMLKQYQERFGINEHLIGDNGWSLFQKSVKIRHRITHPKSEADIEISLDDVETVGQAIQWFIDSTRKMAKSVEEFLKNNTNSDSLIHRI